MFEDPFNVSPLVSRVATRRRIAAFIVTGLAIFLLVCLAWPLSVQKFRTIGGVSVAKSEQIQSREQLKPILSFSIREELKDGRLEAAIQEVQSRTALKSAAIGYREYETISNSLQIGVLERDNDYELQIAYDGSGTKDEEILVDVLAERVAFRISNGRSTDSDDEPVKFDLGVETGEPALNSVGLEQAEWLLNQLESELGYVADKVDGLIEEPGRQSQILANRSTGDDADDSVNVPVGDDASQLNEVKQILGKVDVETLRSIINDAKLASEKTETQLKVNGVRHSKALPLDGVPDFGSFLLILSLAGLVGSIVAWHFDPFEHRGFDHAHSVSTELDLPVLAMLDTKQAPKTVPEHPWANTVAKGASLVLLVLAVAAVGFLVTNPEVKNSFLANPFYGVAEIVRSFSIN